MGGHQRYKVLTAEGATELQCVVVHIEKAEDEKALNIVLNKATGEWEPTALADLLQNLQSANYDLDSTGFDAAEIDDLFSKVFDKNVKDDEPDIDPDALNAFVLPGDHWHLGRHHLVCGDATSADDLNELMGDVRANLLLTDPPYNCDYVGKTKDALKIQNDKMEDAAFYQFILDAFNNIVPHLAQGASAYIFHADTEGLTFRRAFKEAGFHISGVCIWVKNTMVLGRSPYQWQHEPVLYGWLPNGNHKWFADRKQTTVWNFDRPTQSRLHPTMKPIPLLAYPIKNSTAPNAVVLDTFGGSGSKLYQVWSNPAKSGETLSALLSIIPGRFLLPDSSKGRGKSAFKRPDQRPDLSYFLTHKGFKMPICPLINTKKRGQNWSNPAKISQTESKP